MTQPLKSRIILGFAGTTADVARLRELVAGGHEVVTVTLDVGQTADVDHVREHALATGAARAHVFDVREEFARDYVIPTLRHAAPNDAPQVARTEPLAAQKLADVARIERAALVDRANAFDAPLDPLRGHRASRMLLERPVVDTAHAPDAPAHVDLRVENGMPVAINGVLLSVSELLESLAVIGGRHAIGRLPQLDAPAVPIVHAAFSTLNGCDGVVRFALHKGELSVLPAVADNPLLVNHA